MGIGVKIDVEVSYNCHPTLKVRHTGEQKSGWPVPLIMINIEQKLAQRVNDITRYH